MLRKNFWPLALCLSTLFQFSCGKKKEETKSVPKDVQVAETPNCDLSTVGCAVTFTGATMAPTLPDGDYVGVSFTLGDTATRNDGGESGDKVVMENSSKLSLTSKNFAPEFVDLNYMRRLIANRYTRSATDRDPIWGLIRAYDEAASAQFLTGNVSLWDYFKSEQKKAGSIPSLPLTSPELVCPPGELDLGAFGGKINPTSRLERLNVCVMVQDQISGSVSSDDVLAWSNSIVSRYEEIFGAQAAVDGFKPIPWIVLMNASATPSLATTLGAFVRDPSAANKHPVIIINTSQINQTTSRIDTLGTIAHEIYHGISYYYKIVVNKKTLETVAIDEGIAHVMEDIFGNSAKVETGWTSSFIGAAIDSTYPVLNNWVAGFSQPQARGGAHSFMYYLTDMFGGLSAATASATTASGNGINLLRDLIKSPSIGPANIEAVTGFKIPQLMGDFAATVVLDKSSVKAASERWTLKTPFSLTSISGEKVDIGHRFAYDVSTLSPLAQDDFDSPYYALNGFLWTQSGTKKLELSSNVANAGLTLVRIK